MDENNLVSVIIPCYNSIGFIKDAVDSVLSQTYKNYEIIIVDDGSTDGSFEFLIENYSNINNIKILQHENGQNKGVSRTRYLGVTTARGKYLCLLDSDDIMLNNKLHDQVEILEKNTKIVLTHSKVLPFSDENFSLNLYEYNSFELDHNDKIYNLNKMSYKYETNYICNSSVMLRSSSLAEIKYSGVFLFQFEDWLLWLFLMEKGDFHYHDKALIRYRYHSKSATMEIMKSHKQLKFDYSKLELFITYMKYSPNFTVKLKAIKIILKILVRLYRKY